jgi:hypothetical protein
MRAPPEAETMMQDFFVIARSIARVIFSPDRTHRATGKPEIHHRERDRMA